MKRLTQTRTAPNLSDPIKERDNCFATVMACFMDLDSPEEVFQVQEHYPEDGNIEDARWILTLSRWLDERGWDWGSMEGHLYDGSYYLVAGTSARGNVHVCIYKDGALWHDPHPDRTGLLEEDMFEFFEKKEILQ